MGLSIPFGGERRWQISALASDGIARAALWITTD
jgi:hypothetical protein